MTSKSSGAEALILGGVMLAVGAFVGPGLGLLALAAASGAVSYVGVGTALDRMSRSVHGCQSVADYDRQHSRRIDREYDDNRAGNREIAKWAGIAGFACPPLGLAAVIAAHAAASNQEKKLR